MDRCGQQAGKALSETDRIFCLGYSFPITDVMVRDFVISNAPKKDVQFYWVNKEKHQGDLSNVLPKSFKINEDYISENAIESFANDYVAGKI